jgi:hypothetical protein
MPPLVYCCVVCNQSDHDQPFLVLLNDVPARHHQPHVLARKSIRGDSEPEEIEVSTPLPRPSVIKPNEYRVCASALCLRQSHGASRSQPSPVSSLDSKVRDSHAPDPELEDPRMKEATSVTPSATPRREITSCSTTMNLKPYYSSAGH